MAGADRGADAMGSLLSVLNVKGKKFNKRVLNMVYSYFWAFIVVHS